MTVILPRTFCYAKWYITYKAVKFSREAHKIIFTVYNNDIRFFNWGTGGQSFESNKKEDRKIKSSTLLWLYWLYSFLFFLFKVTERISKMIFFFLRLLCRKQYIQRSQIIPFKLRLIWCFKPWNTFRIIPITVAWHFMLCYFSLLSHLFLSRFTD